jgi:hypothetical protein
LRGLKPSAKLVARRGTAIVRVKNQLTAQMPKALQRIAQSVGQRNDGFSGTPSTNVNARLVVTAEGTARPDQLSERWTRTLSSRMQRQMG